MRVLRGLPMALVDQGLGAASDQLGCQGGHGRRKHRKEQSGSRALLVALFGVRATVALADQVAPECLEEFACHQTCDAGEGELHDLVHKGFRI